MAKDPHKLLIALDNTSEKAVRIQTAAVCRLLEHFGWSDAILNHVTARVPKQQTNFFMSPFGLMYDEVCASNLVKVDFAGNCLDENPWPVNRAGVVLHSTIYEARPDINCIIHTHTPYGVAVSALECGLLCNDQMAMLFHDSVGYHDFEGIVIDDDERSRLAQDLANNKCLILRNHGLVATGRTVAEAFWNYYYLEFACQVQILAMASGKPFYKVPTSVHAKAFAQHEHFCKEKAPTQDQAFPGNFDMMLNALMRMLERRGDFSYKD
jgi:ribulose-5-phosphate 4-epimerase/fuculose-1-phosphate aldolase